MNFFESPFKGVPLDQQIRNPNIRAGRYSYYSGYYHGHSFDDCARYLSPERDDQDACPDKQASPCPGRRRRPWLPAGEHACDGKPPAALRRDDIFVTSSLSRLFCWTSIPICTIGNGPSS